MSLKQFEIEARTFLPCSCHPQLPARKSGYWHAYGSLAACFDSFGRYAFRVEDDLTGSILVEDLTGQPSAVDEVVEYLKNRNSGMYLCFDLLNFEQFQ